MKTTQGTNSETITAEDLGNAAPCMYISYFNPFYIVQNSQYIAVQAGKDTSKYNLHIKGDNTGNNISEQNFVYSELTVLYWVWKNAPRTKYVGFCQYRRFFDFENCEMFPLAYHRYSQDEASLVENIPFIDYDKLLSDCDLVMPMNIVMTHSLRRNYERNHYSAHYTALRQAIHELFPNYLVSFNKVLEGTNKLPPYNMFVTRWEVFDSFCHFIFTLFFKLKRDIKMPDDQTQQRIFGYMSERLLAVYIHHHNLKTKEYPLFLFNQHAKKKSKLIFYMGNWVKTLNFKLNTALIKLF